MCTRFGDAAVEQSTRRRSGFPTPEEMGRAVYEQNCQMCHGPELKGDRGPAIDSAYSRLGADGLHTAIMKGKGMMPPFAGMPDDNLNY